MSETIKRINTLLAAPGQARTRETWNDAFEAIKAECAANPIASQLAEVKLPFYGGYTLKQAVGPGGVLAITAAILSGSGA